MPFKLHTQKLLKRKQNNLKKTITPICKARRPVCHVSLNLESEHDLRYSISLQLLYVVRFTEFKQNDTFRTRTTIPLHTMLLFRRIRRTTRRIPPHMTLGDAASDVDFFGDGRGTRVVEMTVCEGFCGRRRRRTGALVSLFMVICAGETDKQDQHDENRDLLN